MRVIVGDKGRDGYGGDAYVFPVRSGTDQVYLEPGQLAMFMTPQIRRAIVMLARIAIGRRVTVHNPNASKPTYEFEGIFEEQNVVRMKRDTRSYYFPLDRILSVYEDPEGWHVVMDVYRYEYGQGR